MTARSPRFLFSLMTATLVHAAVLMGWQASPPTSLPMPSKLVLQFSPIPAGAPAGAIQQTPTVRDSAPAAEPRELQPAPTPPAKTEPALARAEPKAVVAEAAASAEPVPETASALERAGADVAIAQLRVRYEQALAAWLDQHKYYPASLRRRGLEGEGVLRVKLARDGRVLDLEPFAGLPDPLLERVAMDWVRRADPFPAVPEELPGVDYSVRFPVRFRLD